MKKNIRKKEERENLDKKRPYQSPKIVSADLFERYGLACSKSTPGLCLITDLGS